MTEPDGAGFTRVPQWLYRAVSGTAVRVFCEIAQYGEWRPADARYVDCRPAQDTIAQNLGLGRATVQRAMDELEAAGAMERKVRNTGAGRAPSVCTLYVGVKCSSTESEPAITSPGCLTSDAWEPKPQAQASLVEHGEAQASPPSITGDAREVAQASLVRQDPKEPTYHPGTTSHPEGDDQDHLKAPDDLDLSAPLTRQDPLPERSGLVGVQAMIFGGLQRIGLPAVEQDARDIHHRIRGLPNVKNVQAAVKALTGPALRAHWHAVREARAAVFEQQRASMEACPHGDLGGDVPHPLTDVPSCALCRHQSPALARDAPDAPEVQAAVAAWARANPGKVHPVTFGRSRNQLVSLWATGQFTSAELLLVATDAGKHQRDPKQHLTMIHNFMSNQGGTP